MGRDLRPGPYETAQQSRCHGGVSPLFMSAIVFRFMSVSRSHGIASETFVFLLAVTERLAVHWSVSFPSASASPLTLTTRATILTARERSTTIMSSNLSSRADRRRGILVVGAGHGRYKFVDHAAATVRRELFTANLLLHNL